MNKMDKGSLVRTVLLFVALINQLLVALGYAPVPLNEQQIGDVYTVISTAVMAAIAVWAWFKNNYITWRGKRQKEVLEAHNLIKK
ncbi:phage holin [Neobacillus notoginsengisoli]|uniref:Phage holin n=1 Tax=Neobacillus notoginsengisoli TaxID=1578198 RepID=A0A417YR52_9BACI|nr:phage holin [Neobacillus notoginsengisoli]RHW37331.1 phage holin [Neobacillus notoginsengisoli]